MSIRHVFAFIALTACYGPDPNKIVILCGQESPDCPAGQSCVSGVCRVSFDAAISEPPDMVVTTGPDASPVDMATRKACSSGGGTPVGAATACAGVFAKGKASSLCAAGFAPCSVATQVDQAACGSLGSFFAADVPVYWLGTTDDETCGAAAFNQLFAGCGTKGRLSTRKCAGFPRVIDVTGVWAAPDGTLGQASNSDPAQGILCCPAGLTG